MEGPYKVFMKRLIDSLCTFISPTFSKLKIRRFQLMMDKHNTEASESYQSIGCKASVTINFAKHFGYIANAKLAKLVN